MSKRTALYRHFDAASTLLYVGISLSAVQRLKQHVGDKQWASDIAAVTVEYFDTRAEALDAEREAIQNEKPIWNVQHNKRQPINLWDVAYQRLEAAGALYDTFEEAEAAYEAKRARETAEFLRDNPTFRVVEAAHR